MYLILAVAAGVLTVISVSLNAFLGSKVGVMQAILINFIAGFTAISAVLLVNILFMDFHFVSMSGVPIYAFFGGLMGCCITGMSNYVLPKIPVLYASMLMFVGQIMCGIIIDKLLFNKFSLGQLLGGMLIALGIYLVAKVDAVQESSLQVGE